jgi:hypothetical protein
MMKRIEILARGMLRPINPYVTSILGALTFTWGLWILNGFWEVFTSANVFSKAEDFAPEWAWGVWSTLCGLSILVELYRGNFKWLTRSLGFAVWHWWTIAAFLWWGDWQNTAGVIYTFVAIYTTYAYLNIKINYVKPGGEQFF